MKDKKSIIAEYRSARAKLVVAYIDDIMYRYKVWRAERAEEKATRNRRTAEIYKLAVENSELAEVKKYLSKCTTILEKTEKRLDKGIRLSSRQLLKLTRIASTATLLTVEYPELVDEVQELVLHAGDIIAINSLRG